MWLKVTSKQTWAIIGRTAPLGACKNACHSCPVLSPVLVALIIIQRAAVTSRCMLMARSPQRQKDIENKISQCRGKEHRSSFLYLPKERLLNVLCLHILPPGENVHSGAKLAAQGDSEGFLHSGSGETSQVCPAESQEVMRVPHSLLSPTRAG